MDFRTASLSRLAASRLCAAALLVVLGACANDPFRATPALGARGPAVKLESSDTERSIVWRFNEDYRTSANEPAKKDPAKRMYRSGVALVDENCADLLTYLGKARQNLNAGQRATGLAGGVASGVMALTGVAPKTIGLVATSFTALLAGGEIYGETYLFAPDTSAVQKAVRSVQAEYTSEIEAQIALWTSDDADANYFAAAHQAVRGYQSLCEAHSIRQIVDDAIASAKFGIDRESTDMRDRASALVESGIRGRVANELRVATSDVDDQRFAALLALTQNRPAIGRDAIRGMLDGWVGPNAKPMFDIVTATDTSGTRLRATLSGLLANLPDASKARLEKIASEFKSGASQRPLLKSRMLISPPNIRALR